VPGYAIPALDQRNIAAAGRLSIAAHGPDVARARGHQTREVAGFAA